MRNTLSILLIIFTSFIGNETMAGAPSTKYEIAILAGGCFWCLQKPYDNTKGIVATSVGYTGGHTPNPTYKEVSAGGSGHYEALKIAYDPSIISFKEILEVFWRNVDPFDTKGQFCDKGDSYRAAIFPLNKGQQKIAHDSKAAHERLLGGQFSTKIVAASAFFDGEDYHQKYYEKNPIRYKFYRYNCGRDQRLKEVWGEK